MAEIINKISAEPSCVNIIDTPGFGDTRGSEYDQIFFQMIAAVLKEIETLDYIMLVVKATENRFGQSSKFVYN